MESEVRVAITVKVGHLISEGKKAGEKEGCMRFCMQTVQLPR